MKKIVLIAHDRMKPKMAEFIKERADWLWGKELVATGRTAEHMEQACFKVPIHHLSQGRSGGYQEIIEMVRGGSVEMVFSFGIPAFGHLIIRTSRPWWPWFSRKTFPWRPIQLLRNGSSSGRSR